MIEKPKKERRFLKTLGKIGEILLEEVLIKVGSNLIKRIGGKKTLPSILFLFLSISLFAQYPATGNKQRLGYQTTGDGLVYRGRALDTMTIKSSGLNNAYFILDTVNNILYNYIKTKGGWKFSNGDTIIINNTIDTTSLSNRINLKVNIADTTSMLLPYLRKADTSSMLTSYFKKTDTTSLNLVSRFATKLNISDTAFMLTNYLRSGVAASTYLTQSSAALTYLPLTGGTLTGLLKNTSQRLTGNITISDFDNTYNSVQTGPSSSETVNLALQQNLGGAQNISMGGNQGGGGSTTNPNIYFTDNRKAYASIGGIHTSLGTDNQSGHIIFTTTPSLNTVALTERMRISQDGSITMGGTLGVTGATTLTGALTANNATVLNEGSGDFDTRIESDGNANMVFVDASTDRVGIGTNTPSKTLEVNGTFNATSDITEGGLNVLTSADTASLSIRIDGKVSLTGDQTIGGNKTFSGTTTTAGLTLTQTTSGTNKLLGLNSSGGAVGQITVGTGLNLTSDILTATNPTERYYFNLGIVAGAADNSNATYDFTYGSNVLVIPTSLNGYCIDSVYIRAVGCSTCPPVAGDKDYYVGVYKTSAGNRITTSGATLVGSQITMNEYDLNEVNRNDTLTTGDVWWVYLNGTYTSDMAYITAAFIVKKTCN